MLMTRVCCVSHTEHLNYTSRLPGSTSGLQLGLNVDQHSYMYASSASTGFRVSKFILISREKKRTDGDEYREILQSWSKHDSFETAATLRHGQFMK